MGLTEWTSAHKRTRHLRHECKALQQQILQAGNADKAKLTKNSRELLTAVEAAAQLYAAYREAGEHLQAALERIDILLNGMRRMPAAVLKEQLRELTVQLEGVYNDWFIREEDKEYGMTVQNFYTMTRHCSEYRRGMRAIMLRSELENVRAVLRDAAAWSMPDFLAAAYYELHEDKAELCDMEREERSQLVRSYFEEKFWEEWEAQVRQADRKEQFYQLINEYIYGKAVGDCEDLDNITV